MRVPYLFVVLEGLKAAERRYLRFYTENLNAGILACKNLDPRNLLVPSTSSPRNARP
jgi:hypothetical protein